MSSTSSAGWLFRHIHTLDATGGVKPLPDWQFVRGLITAMDSSRILLVAKSRQMLATWTACGWMLRLALQGEPGLFLLLSKGARDTRELVKRMRVIVRELPPELRETIQVKSSEVSLPNGSRILSLPATEDAVRMHSPAAVLWDEMAFTPHSDDIWAAVKPAVDSGGRFIGLSTPNGTDNQFYTLYNDAGNGFGKFRLHWRDHPLRDEDWAREAARGLSEARWRQEYEVDFHVLADRVFNEFDPTVHIMEYLRPHPNAGLLLRGIDFGFRHPFVVWAQLDEGGTLTLFDEWEGCDATVERMAEAIRAVDARHGLSEADFAWSACDPAGAAASDSGLSAVERLERLGFKLRWRQSEILTGVELVKSLLKDAAGKSRLKFCSNCPRTVYHLKHYRWDASGRRPLKDDQHDHAMDALRYLAVHLADRTPSGWSKPMVKGVSR